MDGTFMCLVLHDHAALSSPLGITRHSTKFATLYSQVLLCEGPLPVKFVSEAGNGGEGTLDQNGLSEEWKQRLRAWNVPAGGQHAGNNNGKRRSPEGSKAAGAD